MKITQENQAFLRRLQLSQSKYDASKWDRDFKK